MAHKSNDTFGLPRVEEVISSRPISQEEAFQWLSRFLEAEQNAFDTGEIHQSHWGDMYSIYESIGAVNTDRQEDTMRRLRFMPTTATQPNEPAVAAAPPVVAAAKEPVVDPEPEVEEKVRVESDSDSNERRKKKRKEEKKKKKAPKKAKKTKKKKRDKR